MTDLSSWTMLPSPRVEPTPRWIRVRAGDVEIADSRRALLLAWYGPGMLPTYCLPAEDVHTDLFRPSAAPGPDGFRLDHDLHTGDLSLPGAAQLFRHPPAPLEALHDHWTFTWDAGLSWFEEALEVHVHARDPAKRVDVVPSERHVRVEIDGEVVAETTRPHAGIAGLVAFFNERVDLVVDGVRQERPRTPWSE